MDSYDNAEENRGHFPKVNTVWCMRCDCGGPIYSAVDEVWDENEEPKEVEMLKIFRSQLLAEAYAEEHDVRNHDGRHETAIEIVIQPKYNGHSSNQG